MIQRLFRRRVGVGVDVVIALVLFVAATIGSTLYWRHIITFGPQPYYYQPYFEPAVMVACGKGFVVARPQVAEMVPFLLRQTNRFDCNTIRPDAPLGTEDLFQREVGVISSQSSAIPGGLFGVAWTALVRCSACSSGCRSPPSTRSSASGWDHCSRSLEQRRSRFRNFT